MFSENPVPRNLDYNYRIKFEVALGLEQFIMIVCRNTEVSKRMTCLVAAWLQRRAEVS